MSIDINARLNELIHNPSPEIREAVVKACKPHIFLFEDSNTNELEIRWHHDGLNIVAIFDIVSGKIVEEYAVGNAMGDMSKYVQIQE